MNWSAQQCRLLDALGYERLAHGRLAPAPVRESMPASSPARAARPVPPPSADAATRTTAPTARLLEALRRAANGADPSALAGDLDALRRDPAAKRALWPRLRALRRSH